MKAVRFVDVGKSVEVTDIPTPVPGPGEVLVRVGGAGVCHTDVHVVDHGIGLPGPFTLGHENAGWIAALGQGVRGWHEGDAVAVYGYWGCGYCHACVQSNEMFCENYENLGSAGGGLGYDGGMAEYILVPSARLLAPLGTLAPKIAAPLTDAALTPYHAINRALPLLTADASAVVIGIGGLGHMAVQLLRCLSGARIVAVDVDESKLALAKALGADLAVNSRNGEEAAARILEFCGPRRAAAAFDLVGTQATVDLAAKVVGRNSKLSIVGLGGGTLALNRRSVPSECEVSFPLWGSRSELMEVIALAQSGRIHVEATYFELDDAPRVLADLRDGKIVGRGVLVPNAS